MSSTRSDTTETVKRKVKDSIHETLAAQQALADAADALSRFAAKKDSLDFEKVMKKAESVDPKDNVEAVKMLAEEVKKTNAFSVELSHALSETMKVNSKLKESLQDAMNLNKKSTKEIDTLEAELVIAKKRQAERVKNPHVVAGAAAVGAGACVATYGAAVGGVGAVSASVVASGGVLLVLLGLAVLFN